MLVDKIEILQQAFPHLMRGAAVTVRITTFAVMIGIVIGTILGLARVSKSKILQGVSKTYIEFFRGTPLLIQLFLLHFGLPNIGIDLGNYLAAILGLGLNSGAYVGEIVRSGIISIDKGQMEAARSLGMSYYEAMRYVILPQAIKRVVPPLGNEFIALLKDSSLVSIIAVQDLTRQGRLIISRNYESFLIFSAVAVIYFVMTFMMTRLVNWAERRLSVSD
ncbi:amino acid ABC transporter permease [Halonatronum saccharophilum]|uniref:amino acid ABC transporter permease n=1 Tax=Halonatronum saccharophilum TaxID=150060 RepID=UPI0004851A90|nr:amino acid ABC transporter permease [Halonatronum saccharophilum]